MGIVDEMQSASRERLLAAAQGVALAENELRDAVTEAVDVKLPKTEIARLSGISRMTINAWTKPK